MSGTTRGVEVTWVEYPGEAPAGCCELFGRSLQDEFVRGHSFPLRGVEQRVAKGRGNLSTSKQDGY